MPHHADVDAHPHTPGQLTQRKGVGMRKLTSARSAIYAARAHVRGMTQARDGGRPLRTLIIVVISPRECYTEIRGYGTDKADRGGVVDTEEIVE
mgnify:CR=1 FL=1